MKILKWVGIVILIIISLFLFIPLFLPSTFHIERTSEIEKHVNAVFRTATDMNQRAEWDPWVELEPDAKIELTLNPDIIGSGYSWEGEIIGKGRITIEEFVPNELIKSKIEFISPQSMESDIIWTFKDAEHNTIITWAFEGTLSYPFEKWFGLFMDKSLGPQFEKGLHKFKRLVEKQPDLTGWTGEITEVNFDGLLAITIKDDCPDEKIIGRMLKTFRVLLRHLKANDMDVTDPPFVIYHPSKLENHTLLECALPITKKIEEKDNILILEFPASKTIMAKHFGHYTTVKTTSDALQEYILETQLEVTGSRFEIYITDPMKEYDSRKWETQVYYPIK